MTVTLTVFDVSPLDEQVTVAPTLPMVPSFAAMSVTVCVVFQFAGVKVRLAGETVSVVDPDVRATLTTTFDEGCAASFTVSVPLDASGTFKVVVESAMSW